MLGIAMHIAIKTLFERGLSKKIAEMLGCSGKNVRQDLELEGRAEELKEKRIGSIIEPYEE